MSVLEEVAILVGELTSEGVKEKQRKELGDVGEYVKGKEMIIDEDGVMRTYRDGGLPVVVP